MGSCQWFMCMHSSRQQHRCRPVTCQPEQGSGTKSGFQKLFTTARHPSRYYLHKQHTGVIWPTALSGQCGMHRQLEHCALQNTVQHNQRFQDLRVPPDNASNSVATATSMACAASHKAHALLNSPQGWPGHQKVLTEW